MEIVFWKVGSGVDTCFWIDRLLGEVPLCVRYRRLFELAEDRGISVDGGYERVRVGRGGGGLEVASSFVGVGGGDS